MGKELIYKTGNLLNDPADVLVNTVNTVGIMGKGIALQFKKAFPQNFVNYQKVCQDGRLLPGALLCFKDVSVKYGEKLIINMATKDHWRNPSRYEYIQTGLELLSGWLWQSKAKAIAMSALGCSNGGLEWNKVKKMISEELYDVKQEIIVYLPT
jgi:O-acetyl-ADP-ribose deacetylase (regulator of RNase III)